jgi:hypothetical protein
MNKACVLLAASAAALAMVTAGCGGSAGSKSSSSGANAANSTLEQAVRFTQCMRKNGVTGFPDPDKDGEFRIAAGGPNQNSPQFKRARQACKSQEPPGGFDSSAHNAQSVAQAQREWLKAAQCMRKNGVPNFPDPKDGRLLVPRDKIDVNSPQFKRAMNACRNAAHMGEGSGNGG